MNAVNTTTEGTDTNSTHQGGDGGWWVMSQRRKEIINTTNVLYTKSNIKLTNLVNFWMLEKRDESKRLTRFVGVKFQI